MAPAGGTAYLGSGSALQVVDVSSPAGPTVLGSVFLPGVVEDIAVAGSYAYVADSFYRRLRVVDVSDPSAPLEIGSVLAPAGCNGVALAAPYAFVAADSAGLRVVDVFVPEEPVEVGFVDLSAYATGVAVAGSHAYVATRSALEIVDVSDPSTPLLVGFFDTPGTAKSVVVAGSHVYVADDVAGVEVFGNCVLFADGFESGTTSSWSSSTGFQSSAAGSASTPERPGLSGEARFLTCACDGFPFGSSR